MTTLILYRAASSDNGTFGILYKDGLPLCLTLEEPWNGNRRNGSCIPPGLYHCRPHTGANFKNVWQLQDVPSRDAILIHAGNTIADTSGCILVGSALGTLKGRAAILNSQITLNHLQATLPKTGFEIEILDPFLQPTPKETI